jgi:hypothetical protein
MWGFYEYIRPHINSIMNKNLALLLCILISSFTLHAQTQKGNQLIGGSFSVEHRTTEVKYFDQANAIGNNDGKTNSFNIGPSYSYLVADNLGLGVNLGYNHSHTDNYNSLAANENTSNGYFGSISLMKYFLYEKKIGVRTGPLAYYNYSKAVTTTSNGLDNNQVDGKAFGAGIMLDFVYFPVKRIGLVALLGGVSYSQSKYDNSYMSAKDSNIGLSFLNSPSFSVYYAFGK